MIDGMQKSCLAADGYTEKWVQCKKMLDWYIVNIIKESSFGSILIYRGYYTAMQRCEFYFLSGEVLFLTWQDINFNSSSHLLIFILLYGETDVCTSNSGKVENDFINIFKSEDMNNMPLKSQMWFHMNCMSCIWYMYFC